MLPTGSSHLLRTAGPATCPSTVLLRIEFTASTCLHATGELLPHLSTIPHVKHGKSISVALVRGLPLAGVTRYPCPVEPGLSSRTGFRPVPAVVRPARVVFYPFSCAKSTNILVTEAEKGYNKVSGNLSSDSSIIGIKRRLV